MVALSKLLEDLANRDPSRKDRRSRRAVGAPLNFVTFHADISAQNVGAHPHTDLAQGQYIEMISMLFASARRFHPGSVTTVLTTPTTNLSALGPDIVRLDFDVNAETIMRDRMACQLSMLRDYDFKTPVVLLDSDILINAPLTDVFSQDFDVGLTWRRLEQMPFNGGVIFLNNRNKETAANFLGNVYQVFLERHAHRAKWYGDQTAIQDYLDVPLDQVERGVSLDKDDCRFAFFPCDTYNYSPDNLASEILLPLEDKAILHFKGARKALMPLYFEAHLGFDVRRSFTDLLKQRRARNALRVLANSEREVVEAGPVS